MKRRWIRGILMLFVAVTWVGCASTLPVKSFQSGDLNDLVASGEYSQKVDNFIVVLDASQSMADGYPHTTRMERARDFLGAMNRTIPNLNLKGGLLAFGLGECLGGGKEAMVYGMTDYAADGFAQALDKVVCPGGNTPMGYTIRSAGDTLADAKGNIAMILVSDARQMNIDPHPAIAAEELKTQFGDRLCIYTVMIGDAPKGEVLMKKIADAGQCGSFEKADDLTDAAAMTAFVKKVFLGPGPGLDSDGDGVYDRFDQCPNTPKGVQVDKNGCPLDSDGDGVPDYLDKCPGTPAGVKVDADGCPLAKAPAKWVLEGAWFDFDKSEVKPEWIPNLTNSVEVLNAHPNMKLEIQGHTDNIGTEAYNQLLSEKRANAVKEYLIGKGIAANRLTVIGFGFKVPVAPNDTKENRTKNRRVELIPR